MKLTDVLTALRAWLAGVGIPYRVEKDSPDGLWVVLDTDRALAELIVSEPDFAPYRFVSFTVLDPRLDVTAEPVFLFYDDTSHTIDDILRELDRGLEVIRSL